MLKEGAIRTEFLTKVRITQEEKKQIQLRMKHLKIKKESEYIRKCINLEMEMNK